MPHHPSADQIIDLYSRHASRWDQLRSTHFIDRKWLGQFEGETLYHASLDPEEYRTLLQENGFSVVDHVVEDPEAGGLTVWLARSAARP